MTRYHGRHRKPTTSGRTVAKVAITGMVVGAPLTIFAAPASAANNWDAVAQCESGGNWGISTGNGFSGGLQFTPSTWAAYGGSGSAQNASKSEQIRVAENVLAGQGKGAWPVCGQGLGAASPSSNTAPKQQSTQYTAPKQQSTQYTAPKQQSTQYTAPKQQSTQYTAPKQQSSSAPTTYSAPRSTPGGTYTVQSGDTLAKIAAANNVAGGYQAIAAANPEAITNVNLIFPGQVLKLG